MDHVSITTLWIALVVAFAGGGALAWSLGTRNRQDALRDWQTISDALELINHGAAELADSTNPKSWELARRLRNFARAIRAEVEA